jgi:hypothetical protein
MARLRQGEKQAKTRTIERLLKGHGLGLSEEEIAAELGWDRRTVNNYLRELDTHQKAYRQGRFWFPG